MLHADNEEESGPSIESADPEERIQARRIRIQKRIEQLKREAMGEDVSLVKEVKEEIGKGAEQVEESRKRLMKLISDGTDLVTSVRVALNAREAMYRNTENESTQARIQKLEAEAKTSQEKFDEITKRWTAAHMKEIPHDLHDMLKEQTTACDAVRDEKNKLINDLQMELKQKDDEYVKDLKREAEDVDLMIERMEEQIKNLMKSYRDELGQIETAFEEQRKDKITFDHKRWDALMQQKREKEEEYMSLREKRVEEHEKQLDHLRTQDAEEYNIVKIKLETDVQILEQQLQQMKATYQLNQEKLEYNFQVLKKRDEENTITKSQQKRKITRLQDILNNLRLKLAKQERLFKDENQNLVDDYKRIAEQYKELHKKMHHFSTTDAKKFHDIWCMNEENVRELVDKVLKIDKIIHEQQLGLPWSEPDLGFMAHHGPVMKRTVEKETNALTIAKEILTSVQKPVPGEPEKSSVKLSGNMKLSLYTVKQVLEILCDEAGFLVEEKLNKLLQPLENDERSLIKLDAIFKALNIESEEDINKLANFFYQHRIDETDDSGEFNKHEGLLHPNDILKILKQFVTEHVKPLKDKFRSSENQSLDTSKPRDEKMDKEFWDNMCNVTSSKKLRMWDALCESLDKYNSVLRERDTKIKETDALRQQNAELRMLLHQYITSKVNQELEIPPTRVLQLEYS